MNLERVKILDLGCDPAGEGGSVEAGNALHAAGSGQQGLPGLLDIVADGADDADPGYDDAPVQTTSILSRAR